MANQSAMKNVQFGVITTMPMGLIFCDRNWNLRSDPTAEGDGDDTATGDFPSLCKSIAGEGLRDPVIVRPITGKNGKQFMVVDGHRRFEAHVKIYHDKMGVPGVKAGEIKVIIQNLSEEDARDWNISSGVQRDNYQGADLAWGIKQRVLLMPKKWDGVNQTLMATKYGIHQTHFGRLINIASKVSEDIFNDWRKESALTRLSIPKMVELSKLPPGEQRAKYDAMVRPEDKGSDGADQGGEGGQKKWIPNSRKQAGILGVNLATAQKGGFLTVNERTMFTKEGVESMGIKIKTGAKNGATPAQVNSIVKACAESFKRALSGEESADESDGPKKGGKGKAATAN
jgi:hypothetical protein